MFPLNLFLIVWFVVMIGLIAYFLYSSKKALQIFPQLDLDKITFREKNASGYSTKSMITKMGGSNKMLDVIIVEDELWLTTTRLTAGIANKYDLLHRIKGNNLGRVQKDGKKVVLRFKNSHQEPSEVILILKNPDTFIKQLKKQKKQF